MKKIAKIVALLLALTLAMGVLAGCGPKFDAAGYVKATFDSYYKGDVSNVEKFIDTTEEESLESYQESMASWGEDLAKSYTDYLGLDAPSDEMVEKFTQLVTDIYLKADYTVGTAVEDGDGFIVPVTCRPFRMFSEDMWTTVDTEIEAWAETLDYETVTVEEITEGAMDLVLESMREYMNKASYGSEQTVEIHVVLEGEMYNIPDDDFVAIEDALFPGE